MTSTFTTNIGLEKPARGDKAGTWDTPVNGNSDTIDLVVGAIATISLNNSPVVLSAAQFQSENITFGSTLTGSVTITFPTSFTKPYTIGNFCTGSSAFTITLQTTASGGEVICCPPGEYTDVLNDGTNLKFKNLGHVGSYWDYAGSSNPAWNTGCTKPPYLNCDGSAIPAAYTVLPIVLGSSLLPDSRGRFRATLNQTTSRLNSTTSGLNGNSAGASGGSESLQSHTHSNSLNDPGHAHTYTDASGGVKGGATASGGSAFANTTGASVTGMTITNASAGAGSAQNIPPAYIGGLTLIRAE
jgi:hypothetical protein